MSARDRLLQHLESTGRTGLLLGDERDLLTSAEVRVLPPEEQWTHLAMNRRVGFWVTAVFAGLRLLLLLGGAIAALLFASEKTVLAPDWPSGLLIVAAVIALLWAARTAMVLRRRLKDLGRPLPPYAELELPEESPEEG